MRCSSFFCIRVISCHSSDNGRVTYPFKLCSTVLLAQLAQVVILFLLQVWELLDLGLVEPVDDGILACWDEYPLDLEAVRLEAQDRGTKVPVPSSGP